MKIYDHLLNFIYFNPNNLDFQYAYPVDIEVCFDAKQEFLNYLTK